MKRSQSILEYLVVLSAIVFVIILHTFGVAGVGKGVKKSLEKQKQALKDIATRDYSGQAVDVSELMNN